MNGARIAGASSLIYFCSRYDRPKANLRALVGDTMPSTSTPFARAEPALMLSAVFEGALVLSTPGRRSEEHTSELQSLMRISYAVFCLKKKTTNKSQHKSDNSRQN